MDSCLQASTYAYYSAIINILLASVYTVFIRFFLLYNKYYGSTVKNVSHKKKIYNIKTIFNRQLPSGIFTICIV